MEKNPFSIITGVSVGAINASILANGHSNFRMSALQMKNHWLNMAPSDVYDLGKYGMFSSIRNLLHSKSELDSLFDSKPLLNFLKSKINLSNLNSLDEPNVTLNIHAFNYDENKNQVFTNQEHPKASNSIYVRYMFKHIIASASLPYIFPSIKIKHQKYGDGGLKLHYPSSLMIKQGANKIVGITLDDPSHKPTTIGGNLFDCVFPDALVQDFKNINKRNHHASKHFPFMFKTKHIDTMLIQPKFESLVITDKMLDSLPRSLYLTCKYLGLIEDNDNKFISYLIFDRDYAAYLIEEGYKYAVNRSEELMGFLK
jgi:NTE family protein